MFHFLYIVAKFPPKQLFYRSFPINETLLYSLKTKARSLVILSRATFWTRTGATKVKLHLQSHAFSFTAGCSFLYEFEIQHQQVVCFSRNLTYKNLMGKLWVASFCSQAELIVKTDDDAWVFPCNIKFEVSLHTCSLLTFECFWSTDQQFFSWRYVDLYAAKAITEHLIDFEELR